jgi:hypothetical protein
MITLCFGFYQHRLIEADSRISIKDYLPSLPFFGSFNFTFKHTIGRLKASSLTHTISPRRRQGVSYPWKKRNNRRPLENARAGIFIRSRRQ